MKTKNFTKITRYHILLVILISLCQAPVTYSQLNIAGPDQVKAGIAGDYSTTQCPGMSYAWNVDGGIILFGQGTSKIRVKWDCNRISGDIHVEGKGGTGAPPCDAHATGNLSVTIKYLNEAPLEIKGPTIVCAGNECIYHVYDYKNVTSYQWNVPSDAIIVSYSNSKNSITVKFGTSSGSIEVVPKNNFNHCTNAKAILAVKVNTIPKGAGKIFGKTDPDAGSKGVNYYVNPVAMADKYEWTLTPGAKFSSGSSKIGYSIKVDFDPLTLPGEISVRPVNSCGKGSISKLKITPQRKPFPAGPIKGPTSVCENVKGVTYYIDPVSNATTYQWIVKGGVIASLSTGNSIKVNWGTGGKGYLSVQPVNKKGSGDKSELNINILASGSAKIATVIYNHSSLKAKQKKQLILNTCANASSCVKKEIEKAELNLLFNTGEDYEYGKNKFNAAVVVEVVQYALPSTGLKQNSYKQTLKISETSPEQLWKIDFTKDYNKIKNFDVKIQKYQTDNVVDNDIRLTVFYTEKFKVDVQTSTPLLTVKPAVKAGSGSNQYIFQWTNNCGEQFPNYEFQLLRLYNKDKTKSLSSQTEITAEVDWAKALTIETQSSKTSLTLSIVEGTGYYIWRVRPIGNYYFGGIANPLNWGKWSVAPADHSTVLDSNLSKKPYAFFYYQFDEHINWIYSRIFTEGDMESGYIQRPVRISEQITYANTLQQIRQTQAHIESENKVLASQKLQDFCGRNAITSIDVPIKGKTSLGFQTLFMKNTSKNLYTAINFDKDNNYNNPEKVSDSPGDYFDYYSDNNSDVNIPTAEGYPFSRTLYYNDGTDRIREQGGVGAAHRIKSTGTSRTVKTFYDGVSDNELIKIFGDETPAGKNISKIIEIDANNTATVKYLSKEGRIIATCLAVTGKNPILDALESQKPSTITETITGKSTPYGKYGNESSKRLTLLVPTDVKLNYNLDPGTVKELCHNYCSTCDYILEIIVQNVESPKKPVFYKKITFPPNYCTNITSFKWDSTLTQLPAGTYNICRRITANTSTASKLSTYLQKHLDSLETNYNKLINKSLSPVFELLAAKQIDNLYSYLGINTNVSNPDAVFKDSAAVVNFGCGTINVPIKLCKKSFCPDKYFKPKADFEKYFIEKWIHKIQYWLVFSSEYYLPGYFYGQWNAMINNMLNDPYTPYKCDELWSCWKSLVDNYEVLKYGLKDSVKNSKSEAKPTGITYKFDLAEAFLNCTKRKIRTVSSTAHTNSFSNPGYLSHAYACFNYKSGTHAKCETSNLSDKSGIVKKYASLGPTDYKEWENFYNCVKNNKKFIDDSNLKNKSKLDKPDEQAKKVKALCESVCEDRRKGFEEAVKRLYHNDGIYIEGIDKYKFVYNPTIKGYVPGNVKLESDFYTNPSKYNAKTIKSYKFYCYVQRLVDRCKEGCKLDLVKDSKTGKVVQVGTSAQQKEINKSMTYLYEVDKYSSGCKSGYEYLSGTTYMEGKTKKNLPDGCTICFKWIEPKVKGKPHEFKPKSCEELNAKTILDNINEQIDKFIKKKKEEFKKQYYQICANPNNIKDKFWIIYKQGYHHYTLYYFDRADNLIKTVPPAGVKLTSLTRKDIPGHSLISDYLYNSLKQIVRHHTPDGGETYFYYDLKGQLRFSQNEQQKSDGLYSYTKYDDLGRIIEAGVSKYSIASFSDSVNAKSFPKTGEQKTVTVYSTPASIKYLDGRLQNYILNRVSYNYTDEDGNPKTTNDRVSTYYSYDPHGNVEWLIQNLSELGKKYISYDYDLISGKVLMVRYNEGLKDQFFHRYQYDADNRIVSVETSVDGKIWDKDVTCKYYTHGPLKRTEIGEDKLQGMDYVYTIHGWLKGINHASLDKTKDPGKDNYTIQPIPSRFIADVFGMNLGYYDGDFKRKNSPYNNLESTTLNPAIDHSLYNGNISTWSSQVRLPKSVTQFEYPGLAGQQFRYDELNRLKKSVFKNYKNGWQSKTDFLSQYKYDANGNIVSLTRNANGSNQLMDDLTYNYKSATNLLTRVDDSVPPGNYNIDIDDQNPGNYQYDKIGNLISDKAEEIDKIKWNVYGKVKEIIRSAGSKKPNMKFSYDVNGNRVLKEVIFSLKDSTKNTKIFYVRDAAGKIISVYKKTFSQSAGGVKPVYTLIEQPIYSNDRLGVLKPALILESGKSASSANLYTRNLGLKHYELKDHLSNVRAVISDIKLSSLDSNNSPVVSSFNADLKYVNNYYAFGMLMPDRTYNSGGSSYRYGFNSMEQDPEIKGKGNSYTTKFRQYDPRLGRWMSLDPEMTKYPSFSPFLAYHNNPIYNSDPLGDEPPQVKKQAKGREISPEERMAWEYAKLSGFNSASVVRLLSFQESKSLREKALLRGTVFATAGHWNWKKGSYLSSVWCYGLGILNSYGFTILGDTYGESARNVAIGLAVGTAARKVMGAMTVPQKSGNYLHFAYKPNFPLGHNMVGVTVGGKPTQWYHLVIGETGSETSRIIFTGRSLVVASAEGPSSSYFTSQITVSSSRAHLALNAAQRQLFSASRYNLLNNNCTTFSTGILRTGGLSTPALTPSTSYGWFLLQANSPTIFTPIYSIGASGIPNSVGGFSNPSPQSEYARQLKFLEERL